MKKPTFKTKDIIKTALLEDIGKEDITTSVTVPSNKKSTAVMTAKGSGVIAGLDIAAQVFNSVNIRVKFTKKVRDGQKVRAGKIIAIVKGPARGILTAERTALNFLQRLSGIATLTNKYVKAAGSKVKILDTRKTTPGLRMLEKYAVKCGGGVNHRIRLFDAILIKDNHIAFAGGIEKAVKLAKRKYKKVEVEVKKISQIEKAVKFGATRIMLDNMSPAVMKKSVKMIRKLRKSVEIEASGGITLSNIKKVAKTGIDYISIGALTHSAKALDISLDLVG